MSVSAQQPSVIVDTPPSGQVLIPPENPEEVPKKNQLHIPKYVIIIIAVYVLILYGFVGYTIYKKNTQLSTANSVTTEVITTPPRLPQIAEPTKISTSSAQGFSMKGANSLQVIDLSTPLSTWYAPNVTPHYTNIVIPKELVGKVTAYQYSNLTFIAPKNWYGTVKSDTSNGTLARVYPTQQLDDSAQSVTVYISDPSPRDALYAAYPFFPWIQEHADILDLKGLNPKPDVATTSAITPHLVLYSDARDILELHGVIFSDADNHLEDEQWTTMSFEVRMFKNQRAFADQLINQFIDQFDLKNR